MMQRGRSSSSRGGSRASFQDFCRTTTPRFRYDCQDYRYDPLLDAQCATRPNSRYARPFVNGPKLTLFEQRKNPAHRNQPTRPLLRRSISSPTFSSTFSRSLESSSLSVRRKPTNFTNRTSSPSLPKVAIKDLGHSRRISAQYYEGLYPLFESSVNGLWVN